MESHRRSILKAISYRLLGSIVTSFIAYAIWGSASGALKIGAADLICKVLAYYLHERLWLLIPYGKPKPVEYEI